VSRYQKGKTNLDFTEARDSEWQWHQLGRVQVCTALQADSHASTPPLFFTGRTPFLSPNQQCQSTEGKALTDSAINLASSFSAHAGRMLIVNDTIQYNVFHAEFVKRRHEVQF